MTRPLVLALGSGVRFYARLLTDDAPGTCEAILQRLPLSGTLVHGALSGPEVFLPLEPPFRVAQENWTSNVIPGDVGYYFQPAGMVGRPVDMAEICVFYDRGARPRNPEGPAPINLFARIESDLDALAAHCRRVRTEGPLPISIHLDKP